MSTASPSTQTDKIVAPPKKGSFPVNLAANLANFGISIVVGFWFTPYIIRHLGVAAYGLVPLATTVTSYMSLFTIALSAAVGRNITIALDRQDNNEANRIFNTSFWGTSGVLITLLGPALWLSTKAQLFLNVPSGYGTQFVWLFLCTMGMFFLTAIGSSFGIATYCRNRFDLANAVMIAGTLVRVAVILLLFNLAAPRVWHVGIALLVSTAIGLVLSVVVWRYLTPMLKIQRSAFSLQTLRQLTGMGGWIVITHIGSILFLSIDLVVVNKMIGAEAGGQYGAVMLWSTMLRNLAGVVAGVFGPTIVTLYGRQEIPGLVAYSRRAVKFVGLMVALPIGLICGFAQPLLSVWLGQGFAPLAPLMALMSIHLCVNLSVLPLFNIPVAANRVRLPGILTCIMGAGNLGLALMLAGPVGWGMYGVAAAGAIMLTAKNLVFTPLYASHILGVSYGTFSREILPAVGTTAALSGIGWLLTRSFNLDSWLSLGIAAMGLTCVFVVGTCRWLISADERDHIVRMLPPRDVFLRFLAR